MSKIGIDNMFVEEKERIKILKIYISAPILMLMLMLMDLNVGQELCNGLLPMFGSNGESKFFKPCIVQYRGNVHDESFIN